MMGKLRPLIDNLKTRLPKNIFGGVGAGVRRVLKVFKFSSIATASLFLSLLLTAVVWFNVHPINGYRVFLANWLRQHLDANELRLGDLSWKFSAKTFSFGLQAEHFSFYRNASVERFHADGLMLSVAPLKFFTAKIPLTVTAQGGALKLAATSFDSLSKEADSNEIKDLPKVSAVFRRVYLDFDFHNLSINIDPKLVSAEKDPNANYHLETKRVRGAINGIPGSFEAQVETHLDLEWGGALGQAVGPAVLALSGNIQDSNGSLLGANFHKFEANFSDVRMLSEIVNKKAGQVLKFSSKAQAHFGAKNLISKFEFTGAQFQYEELILNAELNLDLLRHQFEIGWDSGVQDVAAITLPLAYVHGVPFRGIVESKGSLKLSAHAAPEFVTKLSLNNFRLRLKDLAKLGHVDSPSSGDFQFSLVFELDYKKQLLSAPRIEMQFVGNDTQVELDGGRYVKPRGDSLELLLKAKMLDGNLALDNFSANINNLVLNSRMTIAAFNEFVHGRAGAKYNGDLRTNVVDLSEWTSYLPWFRKIPLRGAVEGLVAFDGTLGANSLNFSSSSWRIDRLNINNVRGVFEDQKGSGKPLKIEDRDLSVEGPFSLDFVFSGRGSGLLLEKGLFSGILNFDELEFRLGNWFVKPKGRSLSLDVAVEQTQNRLNVKRGLLRLIDNALKIDGSVLQGSTANFLKVKLDKPINLESWRPYFLSLAPDFPALGEIAGEGQLFFGSSGMFEKNLDWAQLGFAGNLRLKDVALNAWPFAYPITKLSGQIVVLRNDVNANKLRFEVDKSLFEASGKISFMPLKSEQGNLSYLFSKAVPWKLEAQIDVGRLREDVFGFPSETKVSPTQQQRHSGGLTIFDSLRHFVRQPHSEKSVIDVRLRAREASSDKVKSQNFLTQIKWSDGKLSLDPLQAKMFGGVLRGSFVYDAHGFYLRKDPPQISFQANVDGGELSQIAPLYNVNLENQINGKFNGSIRVAADGFDLLAMRKTARGRVEGAAAGFEFLPFQKVDLAIRDLITKTEASDYLTNSNPESCLSGEQQADFDIHLSSGETVVQKFSLIAKNRTRLNGAGSFGENGSLDFRAKLAPGPQCLALNAADCLKERVLEMRLSESVVSPKLDLDVADVGRSIASCMSTKVEKQVRQAIENEGLSGSQERKNELELRNRLRRSLQ